jgi:hypothetical protein
MTQIMKEIYFSNCVVRVYPENRYLETVFDDGRIVPASPQDNDSYRQTAREYGYGEDTFRLCLHHEILHTLLAELRDEVYSPVLRAVAEGRTQENQDQWSQEEERVMKFHKLLIQASQIHGW